MEEVKFKASGKQVVEPGWRVVFAYESNKEQKEDNIMPEFVKGETGPHEPMLYEKETQPPRPYTEATLLRAMETAGKQVDDEELRDLMKENGIGRPSTRAAIIETLFKRKYIHKVRKNLHPTVTGVQLIGTIRNDMLKSAELTGMWEKKLREIETGKYDVAAFMDELKQMVSDVVFFVRRDQSQKKIEIVEEEKKEKKIVKAPQNSEKTAGQQEMMCPRCGKGHFLKGKGAWGCSEFTNGCKTIVPFEFMGKKFTDNQIQQLVKKGKTSVIKGLEVDGEKVSGIVKFNEVYQLVFEPEKKEEWVCPSCKQGVVIKGKKAYGCNNFKNGCRLRIPFEYMGKS